MKKMIALILSLVLVFSITATVSADGEQTGSMILTAEIPAPSYTIHIPADFTLEYGNTEKQEIGAVYVTDVKDCNRIVVNGSCTALVNTADPADKISLVLYNRYDVVDVFKECSDAVNEIMYEKEFAGSAIYPQYDANGYCRVIYAAEVSDWSGATAGATYQSTVTFNFKVKE